MTDTLTADRPPDPPAPTRRARAAVVVPVALIVVGLLVLLYPVVATQWNNAKQIRVAEEYTAIEQGVPPVTHDTELAEAHEYNRSKAEGAILDPWLARVSEDNVDYQEYLRQLDQQQVMARLVIPKVTIDLPVYHGTTERVLERGVGHLYGSDLPIGGTGTHAALTGHTGLPRATLFDNLDKVEVGDAVYVAASGQRLKYEVDQIRVVLPEQIDDLAVVPGQDLLTLITCTPYGINSHRILVRAHQVPMDPAEEAVFDEPTGLPWQWWMWAILTAVVVMLGALAWWLRHTLRGPGDEPRVGGGADESDDPERRADG